MMLCLVLFFKSAVAKVTLMHDYVMQTPAKIVIPLDVPVKASKEKIAERGIRILVFGDSGTGDENQMKVAASMKSFCTKNECDFALMLGDNFHPRGVQSVDDPQFIKKFEKPYAFLGIPIFAILGEHDWGRNGEMYNWKAEIDYTKKSSFWRMPSDVYSVTFGNLKILALNTNAIPVSKAQIDWLRNELEKSKARWNLVMGHKPIHSYGYHGDTDFMVSDVLPILCGRADLYIASHDHNEQVLRSDCGLPLIVSGSAGKLRTDAAKGPRSLFALAEGGFSYLEVKDAELTVKMVSSEGNILYELVISKNKT
jgi:acid phosphatase